MGRFRLTSIPLDIDKKSFMEREIKMAKSKCQNCQVKEDCLRYFPEHEELTPSKYCKFIVMHKKRQSGATDKEEA